MSFSFAFDTRFFKENEKLYFRKGVWNTIDGQIDISKIDNIDLFLEKMVLLQNGSVIEKEEIDSFSEKDKRHFDDLINMGFLINTEKPISTETIKLLTGQNYVVKNSNIDFTLVTNSDFIESSLTSFSDIYNFTFTRLEKNTMNELTDNNLFSKVNSLEFEKKKIHYSSLIPKKPILVILDYVEIGLLNNLNILASKERPLFIGFMDGPFLVFLSVIPKVTACWECFEQRMHAFLKDHVLYNKFLNIQNNSKSTSPYNFHLTHLLHMGLQEVFSWCQIKMSKFMGRVMFIYLPTFEIHFHNIDRISSCTHCGYISSESCKNSNISLNHILQDFLRNKVDEK